MLGAAHPVLLAATGCQARPSPTPYDGGVARSEPPPTVSRVGGATFPFVTVSNPPLSHAGVASRPS
jgi:hypothetical protein